MKIKNLALLLALSHSIVGFCANIFEYNYRWHDPYVSTSDIAINAREVKSGVAVWTTSVSTGETLENVKIEVYSRENELISEGMTDRNGWCFCPTKFNNAYAVVASLPEGKERTSLTLGWETSVTEDYKASRRKTHVEPSQHIAFAWTERGIYRHEERIFFRAIVRNHEGIAPQSTSFKLRLVDPTGIVRKEKAVMSDEVGAVSDESFVVSSDLPSGRWTIELRTDDRRAAVVGSRAFSVEEFAPPQVRVTIEANETLTDNGLEFKVKGEHLFGGPAKGLLVKGKVLVVDMCNSARSGFVKELDKTFLNEEGEAVFVVPTEEWMRNSKRLTVTISADIIEDGGRAATARKYMIIEQAAAEESINANVEMPVRAEKKEIEELKVTPDKSFYRVGEVPELKIESPFEGKALITIIREDIIYAEVTEVEKGENSFKLRTAEKSWAPNVDARVCVVKAGDAAKRGFAARAYSTAVIKVRPEERELAMTLKAEYHEKRVSAEIFAPAYSKIAVSLVDEGIHILSNEKAPNPIGFFAEARQAPINRAYDIYHNLRPLSKTGGDIQAEILGRISPVPTRRFKPLSKWRIVEVGEEGRVTLDFDIDEFVGEVRLTALGCTKEATGAVTTQVKCTPKLVIQPDAPRFVAPKDEFMITLPIKNRSVANGVIGYSVEAQGETILEGKVELEAGKEALFSSLLIAPEGEDEIKIDFKAEGLGETHSSTLLLPIRPAAPWHEEAGVMRLKNGEEFVRPENTKEERYQFKEIDPSQSEIEGAMKFLASYPYGCLEQTSSKILPLVGEEKYREYVIAGVRRVESMVDWDGFYMWPDCDYHPWDREVSIFAAHFLIEAERSGITLNSLKRSLALNPVSRFALDRSVSSDEEAYASMVLALAYRADRGAMNALYNRRDTLSLFARSTLALAYAEVDDWEKVNKLLAASLSPSSVKEAAFSLAAVLSNGQKDERAHALATYLTSKRDKARYSWGTTGENALAIWALKKYYKVFPISGEGDRFLAWRKFTLKKPEELPKRADTLSIKKRFCHQDGSEYDLMNAKVGDYVLVELTLSSDKSRNFNDLVIEDLFPAAFEPIIESDERIESWVMRYDTRDDRELVFSKKFYLGVNEKAKFRYALRVVSKGDYIVPACSVEAMYDGTVGARDLPRLVVVRD